MSLPQNQFGEHDSLRCPAKINIRLKVTGRRADGYHYLSMINAALALHDTMRIAITSDAEVRVSVQWHGVGQSPDLQSLGDARQNLAARAVEAFRERFDLRFGAHIEIEKRIPLGGGLAGGSSNAATVLAYLMRHFKSHLPESCEVITDEIAATLGADVPYLLRGGLAWVGGIGEKIALVACEPLKESPVALIFPPFGLSTAAVFSKVDPRQFKDDSLCEVFREEDSRSLALQDVWSLIDNDLIEPALLLKEELNSLLSALKTDSDLIVSMSGSGSTLFAVSRRPMSSDELNERVQMALQGYDTIALMTTFAGY